MNDEVSVIERFLLKTPQKWGFLAMARRFQYIWHQQTLEQQKLKHTAMKKFKALLAMTVASLLFGGEAMAQDGNTSDLNPTPVFTTPDDPGNSDPSKEPVSLSENSVQALQLYPNPSIGSEFTMDLPLNDDEQIALYIYDMNGRVVERKSGTYAELRHFRFRHLQEAAYIVKVFSQEVLFQSRVLVVHR